MCKIIFGLGMLGGFIISWVFIGFDLAGSFLWVKQIPIPVWIIIFTLIIICAAFAEALHNAPIEKEKEN